jgi:hypothetical protein
LAIHGSGGYVRHVIRPRDFFLVPLTVAVTGTCLIWGGYATFVAIRNWSPTEVTCAEFAAHRPDARWLRLTECEPDFVRMGVETMKRSTLSSPQVTAVYIPLYARDTDKRGRAPLVVSGDDRDMLALGGAEPSRAAFEVVAKQLDGPIEGLAMSVLSMSSTQRQDLRDLHLALADDFVVIDRDARPRPLWLGLGVLAIGIAGAARIRSRQVRARRDRPAPLARATVVAG